MPLPEMMSYMLPYILLMNFTLICALFVLKFRNVSSRFKDIKKTTWVMFLVILVLGSGVRVFWPGCMTGDITWVYVERGHNMIEEGRALYSDYPYAYSFLVALSFVLFGSTYETVLFLNVFLSSLTVLIVFLLSYALFRKDDVSLFSAMVFSLLPIHIFWTMSGVSETASTFLAALALLFFVISLDRDKKWIYALSFITLAFSVHARLDNVILIPVFILGFLLKKKMKLFSVDTLGKLGIGIALFIVFFTPLLYFMGNATIFLASGQEERAGIFEYVKAPFSFDYLVQNISLHLSRFAIEGNYPLIFVLFLVFSLAFVVREWKLLFPVSWIGFFLLFYGFYWGSQGSNLELWQMLIQPPVAILMGYGIFSAKNLVETYAEKLSGFKIKPVARTVATVAVLILIFLVFFIKIGGVGPEIDDNCMTREIKSLSGLLGENDCLLIENSWFEHEGENAPEPEYYPIDVMARILHEENVAADIDGCEGKNMFFMDVKDNCQPSSLGDVHHVREILKGKYEMTIVKNTSCVNFYRVGS